MSMMLNLQAYHAWAPGAPDPAAWQAWAAGALEPCGDEPPPLKDIKPMQRRRLSLAARAAFEASGHCLAQVGEDVRNDLICVFASANGPCGSTAKMLETLALEEALSPTAFSLSVHNAVAGQFSIIHGLHGPSISLATGYDGLGSVFVEALGLMDTYPGRQALVCCWDEPVTETLRPPEANAPTPLACAMLLAPGTGAGTSLTMTRSPEGTNSDHEPFWRQMRTFVSFLAGGERQLTLPGALADYAWHRDVAG